MEGLAPCMEKMGPPALPRYGLRPAVLQAGYHQTFLYGLRFEELAPEVPAGMAVRSTLSSHSRLTVVMAPAEPRKDNTYGVG
jgi:hypothetical protein